MHLHDGRAASPSQAGNTRGRGGGRVESTNPNIKAWKTALDVAARCRARNLRGNRESTFLRFLARQMLSDVGRVLSDAGYGSAFLPRTADPNGPTRKKRREKAGSPRVPACPSERWIAPTKTVAAPRRCGQLFGRQIPTLHFTLSSACEPAAASRFCF